MSIPTETTDSRVAYAREFLDAARRRWLEAMKPSELIREAGELRKLLGQALDVIAERREVLAAVIADAISYRTPEGHCADCQAEEGGLCYDHAADLDRTDDYLQLARELGIEVEQ
jgi:hypothetical protein